MTVTIRKFEAEDIERKVKWINTPEVNRYLHYDLPLQVDKTSLWYESASVSDTRYDAVIEADGEPCGLIGLLSIDRKNRKAEYYVAIGDPRYFGHRVAEEATALLLRYAFGELRLNRVYLYTEVDNLAAQHMMERAGFLREGCLVDDLFSNGRYISRYVYGICSADFTASRRT